MGDGGVTGFEEGAADGSAKGVAFSADGMDINGKVSGKGVKDGTGRDRSNMGLNGGEGRAKGCFLEERFSFQGGKRRERDGRGLGSRAKGDGGESGLAGGGGDGGRGKLDHGGGKASGETSTDRTRARVTASIGAM